MDVKKRLKDKSKIIMTTIISIILIFIIFKIIYINVTRYVHLQIEEKAIKFSEILVGQISGNKHEQFVKGNNIEDAFSEEINRLLLSVKEKFLEISNIYIIVQTGEPNVWKIALTTDTNIQNKTSFERNQNLIVPGIYLGSFIDETLVYGEEDSFISVYKPIYNSHGEQIAILGMDVNENATVEWVKKLLNTVWFFLMAIILILCFVSLISIDKILKSIKSLIEQSKEIRQRKRLYFKEDMNYELGLLVKRFNKILQKNRYRTERRRRRIRKIIEEKENIFAIYKEVIGAATQNKILLLSRKAFIEKMSGDFPIYSTKLTKNQDITRCRGEIDNVLAAKDPPWWNGKNRISTLLCLSEATTNAVKHAGSGEVLLSIKDCKLTIYILDCEKGIDLERLPHTIFIKGFSTKQASLGAGFLLMGRYMDKIILSTSGRGTFLALQKQMCGEG